LGLKSKGSVYYTSEWGLDVLVRLGTSDKGKSGNDEVVLVFVAAITFNPFGIRLGERSLCLLEGDV